ncbi:MAG: 3-deoxy-manno-octulosonate cytidylyltransferase [Myxococcota bacterium]
MILAVIPARYDSTRLPGKALAEIGGTPMVVRVWERVRRARGVGRVVVATDDERIARAAASYGAEVVMTGTCASGTDRVAAAALGQGARVVVNVQGDEPFVEPDHVDLLADAVTADTPIATLSAPLLGDPADPARVKVVCDARGRALYFSRQPLPRARLHLGLYAFSAEALAGCTALPPSPLEQAERLEQLRWLEAGWAIRVVPVAKATLSVDTPADLERARAMAAR